jgi:hypothetical protein
MKNGSDLMNPTPGDIYCVFVPRLGRYAACQITKVTAGKDPTAVQLCLDWTGGALPTPEELVLMKPLTVDFMYWDDELVMSNVNLPVPSDFIFAGNIPPLMQSDSNSYSEWDRGLKIYHQMKWREIPEEQRQRFKEARKSDETIVLFECSVRINRTYFRDDFDPFENVLALRALPCLSGLTCERWHEDLYEYLRANPFLIELHLEAHGQTTLDFRNSHLCRLGVQMDGVEALYLNDDMEELRLRGDTSRPFTVYAKDGGKYLSVWFTEKIVSPCGLAETEALHCSNIDEFDMAAAVAAYPHLRRLELWGKPGTIRNFSALSAFENLEQFAAYDLFSFGAGDIPAPDALPRLTELRMVSLPEAAAKAVKKLYEGRKGLYLRILKGRKDEWLAENLDNPFRDWDGDERISAANAKKAAALYKKTRKAILNLTQGGGTETDLSAALTKIVSDYTNAFNQMDKRGCLIETVEREQIYEVLCGLLGLLPENISGEQDRLLEVFDAIRDF